MFNSWEERASGGYFIQGRSVSEFEKFEDMSDFGAE
jgi:hypothetical protein